ncbi:MULTISPECIES: AMP-binding protein [unclassified Streptomyces]|uniref:Acyl--CoA ligase n=1 Tax=Streptomyces sp. NBC_00060 TaxID=2975636 RepID=A0AAU2H8J3_9ACTN
MDSVNFPSASLGQLPDLAADRHGETPFLSDTPWLTYGKPVSTVSDFVAAVHDYADRLWAAGVRRDDVVAVVKQNHVDIQALMCAVARLGALPALLSARMDVPELMHCIRQLGSPVVVMDQFAFDRTAPEHDVLRTVAGRVLTLDQTDAAWALFAGEREAHQVDVRDMDEWAVITHSSGTTGVPKLAAHSTRSLFEHVAPQLEIIKKLGNEGLSAKHLSFVHVRMSAGTLAALELAMPLLAIADPEPQHVKSLLLQHRPEGVETHPNVYLRWEPMAADAERPFASVSRFISTFDAMHPATVRALLAGSDQPHAMYIQGYGQTESGPVAARMVTRKDIAAYETRNVGYAAPGREMRITGADGEPVPTGEVGSIEVRTPSLMRGYIGGQPTVDGSWLAMGDVGRLLPDGSLELLDRVVDYTPELGSILQKEDVLLGLLPELLEVVLVPCREGGPTVAVVCPRDGEELDPSRFDGAAREAGLDDVRLLVRTWDELPMTGSYKVRRLKLREQLTEQGLVRA